MVLFNRTNVAKGIFNRMHSVLAYNSIMLRCDTADCYAIPSPGVFAFVGNGLDFARKAVFEYPQASGVNFCPRFWNTTPVWDDVLKYLVVNDTHDNRDRIAVKTLMHEMAHTLQVAQKPSGMSRYSPIPCLTY